MALRTDLNQHWEHDSYAVGDLSLGIWQTLKGRMHVGSQYRLSHFKDLGLGSSTYQ